MKEYSERINEFAEMIKESENVVFFGGAGVSTESGIKDYRSRDGIYSTVKDYGTSPEEILSHDFFMQSPCFISFTASIFWEYPQSRMRRIRHLRSWKSSES